MRWRSAHAARPQVYPSLDIIAEHIHRTVGEQSKRAAGLDQRNGVLLGFTGLLAGMIFSSGPIRDRWPLSAALLTLAAAAAAGRGMFPVTANAIRPELLIEEYAAADREESQLIVLSTIARLYDEQEDRVGRKGTLLRVAGVLLLAALFALFFQSLVVDTSWQGTWSG